MWKKLIRRTLIVLAILFVAIQLWPHGHQHPNPPDRVEPKWNAPRTRELAVAACFDCHSNQTYWPWYAYVAPVSWLVLHDTEEGRRHLNFDEFDRRQKNAKEAADEVESGEMPPWYYALMHGRARLSDADKTTLIEGLRATFGED
jgi:hypothetical protein